MRKFMALGLLMLIFANQVGYYGLFAIEQTLIRYEQRKNLLRTLSNHELQRIPLQASMEFMDDGQEFSLNGEQYDIIRQSVESGITVFYAVNDKDETRLLKKLADTGRSHNPQEGGKKGLLKVSNIYCSVHMIIQVPPEPEHLTLRPVLPNHYSIVYHQKMVRPPDDQLSA